jgi:hypothetical protein
VRRLISDLSQGVCAGDAGREEQCLLLGERDASSGTRIGLDRIGQDKTAAQDRTGSLIGYDEAQGASNNTSRSREDGSSSNNNNHNNIDRQSSGKQPKRQAQMQMQQSRFVGRSPHTSSETARVDEGQAARWRWVDTD